jgi:hypothetical protein
MYVDQAKSKRAREVFLTQEEAKKKKLQKGYVLEPIVPKNSSEAQPVSAKRERKKSYHFGTSVVLWDWPWLKNSLQFWQDTARKKMTKVHGRGIRIQAQ